MVRIYLLYTILAAASALGAPIAQRDNQDLSSHTGSSNEIIDNTQPLMPPVVLPPLAVVFAMMDADPSDQSASSASASATSPSASADVVHMDPGPVEVLPTGIVSPSEQTDSPYDGNFLAHKFIFALVVTLSMFAVVFAMYSFSYHCNRHRERSMTTGEGQAPPEEKEKGRCSVVDISRNFPRSKFSVTSSDYPVSARASSCDSESECSSDADSAIYGDISYPGRGLMNPALFFGLRRSSATSSRRSSRRHSRNGSLPAFGISRLDARREHSRRSRSVSGSREEWI
ncbi:hypothetical protein K438DRAFT_1997042 [Mycena galopus ATCC 62051]|nr:hypothetical protein K438DRAFT_1997042 [Mycena galopus ATCC 62051]